MNHIHNQLDLSRTTRSEDLNDIEKRSTDGVTHIYLGEYATAADWARDVLAAPEFEQRISSVVAPGLRSFVTVDYEAFARDAATQGEIRLDPTAEGRVRVYLLD